MVQNKPTSLARDSAYTKTGKQSDYFPLWIVKELISSPSLALRGVFAIAAPETGAGEKDAVADARKHGLGKVKESRVVFDRSGGVEDDHLRLSRLHEVHNTQVFRRLVVNRLVGVAIGGQLQVVVGVAGIHGLVRRFEFHDGVIAGNQVDKAFKVHRQLLAGGGIDQGNREGDFVVLNLLLRLCEVDAENLVAHHAKGCL